MFHLDGPAAGLFTNFEIPARQVTLLHYADDLGLPTASLKLVPVSNPPEPVTEATPSAKFDGPPQVEKKRVRVELKAPL